MKKSSSGTARNWIIDIVLITFIMIGVIFRFVNLDWDSGALLHPDEYGFANTLTRLSFPRSLGDYFNTRISPISPYNKYDEIGNKIADGPDNRMRWGQLPITIIRLTTEIFGTTGYSEGRMTGRVLSALADVGSLLLLIAIALTLFRERRVALLAAAFFALSVMPIQQSHFATSDNFAVFFVMLTVYAGAKIAVEPSVERTDPFRGYRITKQGYRRYILFGLFLGMAVSCKINMVAAAVVLFPAAFVSAADVKLSRRNEFWDVIGRTFELMCIAGLATLISFRLFQPMSFRAAGGDTFFWTLRPNQDWLDSMAVSAIESSGMGGGPPAEQWAHRLPIVFPLVNMIGYGMGVPLGLTVWLMMIAAFVGLLRGRSDWKAILIPFIWSAAFFLFMGTRFVKSIRYMLPIYPMLCLVAAWGLIALHRSSRKVLRIVSVGWVLLTLIGTLVWASMFVKTIYFQPHSRVEAVRWMYRQIPSAFQFESEVGAAGERIADSSELIRLQLPETVTVSSMTPYRTSFKINDPMSAASLRIAKIEADTDARLSVMVRNDQGATVYQGEVAVQGDETYHEVVHELETPLIFVAGVYELELDADKPVRLRRNVLANESWDEGLPFRMDGIDPFGQLYTGATNEVRWADSEGKKEMFLSVLDRADYIILPSQRSIWSAVRIPKTYPMTLRYYEALFDGTLGFTLEASFSRPFRLGSFYVSDLVGEAGFGDLPDLPIYNLRLLSAEEAFSVYDHPPVWIFKKNADFDLIEAADFLNEIDLSAVVVQGPRDAEWPDGYSDGRLF